MSKERELRQFFANVPVHRLLGMRMITPSPEEAIVEMDVSPDMCQETGVVHGGIVTSLADATAANLFQPYIPEHLVTTSIELKMNFLRPVLADQGKLVARGSVLKRGRKVSVAEVEIKQAGKLVAKGLFTFLFVDKNEWSGKADEHT